MNHSQLRRKNAKFAEDELFTLQTELDNMSFSVEKTDFKKIKILEYQPLMYFRQRIQNVIYSVKELNKEIKKLNS